MPRSRSARRGPIHMHLAEQVAEVEEVQTHLGARPTEWLLEPHAVDRRWCLIHCTQMTPDETRDWPVRALSPGCARSRNRTWETASSTDTVISSGRHDRVWIGFKRAYLAVRGTEDAGIFAAPARPSAVRRWRRKAARPGVCCSKQAARAARRPAAGPLARLQRAMGRSASGWRLTTNGSATEPGDARAGQPDFWRSRSGLHHGCLERGPPCCQRGSPFRA